MWPSQTSYMDQVYRMKVGYIIVKLWRYYFGTSLEVASNLSYENYPHMCDTLVCSESVVEAVLNEYQRLIKRKIHILNLHI